MCPILGKINVFKDGDKEVLFYPWDIQVNPNGAIKSKVKASIFHGFYYVVSVQSQMGDMTLYTKEPQIPGADISFDILRN